MNCEVCGTELPHGAIFCGECGRSVGTRTATVVHPDTGMPVSTPVAANPSESALARESRDTAIIQPIEQDVAPELLAEDDAIEAAEPDIPTTVAQRSSEPARVAPPRPDPFPWGDRGSAIFSDSDELEQTLIVPRRETGERFVLQFSTGESITVFGSGLLGRNPTPQPTEYFDQLVIITDPGKSVSKTHLEFGQEAGSFWVSDRFSGNGSAVREPESAPRRLVAGKRYRIVRGTRVDIGEQFFVVS